MRARIGGVEYDIVDIVPSADRARLTLICEVLPMSMRIKVDIAKFKEQLRATADELNQTTRPAAQSGAQIIYSRARQLVPVSTAAHKFYGSHAVYGPYKPGTLRDSILSGVFERQQLPRCEHISRQLEC